MRWYTHISDMGLPRARPHAHDWLRCLRMRCARRAHDSTAARKPHTRGGHNHSLISHNQQRTTNSKETAVVPACPSPRKRSQESHTGILSLREKHRSCQPPTQSWLTLRCTLALGIRQPTGPEARVMPRVERGTCTHSPQAPSANQWCSTRAKLGQCAHLAQAFPLV